MVLQQSPRQRPEQPWKGTPKVLPGDFNGSAPSPKEREYPVRCSQEKMRWCMYPCDLPRVGSQSRFPPAALANCTNGCASGQSTGGTTKERAARRGAASANADACGAAAPPRRRPY